MANPQKENGYIQIANEVWEALARTNLSGAEFRVVMAILRQTWGWKEKEASINQSQLSELTGISDRTYLTKITNRLSEMRIVSKTIAWGKPSIYRFNKDYEQWSELQPVSTDSQAHVDSQTMGSTDSQTMGSTDSQTMGSGVDTLLHERKYKESIKKDSTTTFSEEHEAEPTGVVGEFLDFFRDEITGQGFVAPYNSFKRIYSDLGNDDIVLRLRLETALETCSKDGSKPSITDVMKYLRRSVVDDIKAHQEELKNKIILGFGDELEDWEFEQHAGMSRPFYQANPAFRPEAKRRYDAWMQKQAAA